MSPIVLGQRLRRTRRWVRSERGSLSLEMVIIAPALLLLVSVLIVGGRMALAGQAVQQAASEAAREASIARTPGEAGSLATSAARSTLAQQDLDCVVLDVSVDTGGMSKAPGESATVTATVSCPVRLGDLSVPGVPGSRTVTQTASSPVDVYRERS